MRRMNWGCLVGFCFFIAGCLSQTEIESDFQAETSPKINCPANKITIQNLVKGEEGKTPDTFEALGCDREWKCSFFTSDIAFGPPKEKVCTETEDSKDRTSKKMAVQQLSAQSGCSVHRIEVNQGVWSSGNKKIYRMNACGRQFVCTLISNQATCKEGSTP